MRIWLSQPFVFTRFIVSRNRKASQIYPRIVSCNIKDIMICRLNRFSLKEQDLPGEIKNPCSKRKGKKERGEIFEEEPWHNPASPGLVKRQGNINIPQVQQCLYWHADQCHCILLYEMTHLVVLKDNKVFPMILRKYTPRDLNWQSHNNSIYICGSLRQTCCL